jgi:Rps23 Pro-64 3,4-dihydroxylase Tpa1-like proline 4-hydroxylase
MALFDYDLLVARLPSLSESYRTAEEFPHIVLDDLLDSAVLEEAVKQFPAVKNECWIHYRHFNERKIGLNKRDFIPPSLLAIIDELNSDRFVAFLSSMTGIPGLIADPTLEGGGLHQIERGGFLNIHADFTVHPHRRNWRRRVNVLVYLNPQWEEQFGGHLELWTKDMKRAFRKVLPILNRCVIFNTDRDSFHGHPDPLTCLEGTTRKSIALYYFTEESGVPTKIGTHYQSRPVDGLRTVGIYVDNRILWSYNWLKGKLGINDDFASRVLHFISRKADKNRR